MIGLGSQVISLPPALGGRRFIVSELLIILPAIDIRGGRCVRLRQGDYAQETIFDENPVAVAEEFQKAGARWLHVVDLDGAREGELRNLGTIRAIVAAVGSSVEIEVGGGIRTTESAESLFDMGVRRIVAGTRAVTDPAWLAALAARFPQRVAVGVDARGGRVAVEGWRREANEAAATLVDSLRGLPLAAIIYTDIVRDGMMSGPNVEAIAAIVKAAAADLPGPGEQAAGRQVPVIASGGVTTIADIRRLKAAGAAGAIIGRALYEGNLMLEAALDAAGDQHI